MGWISVKEKLPEPEARVLVCAEAKCGEKVLHRHIVAAMYEDGTVWRDESSWSFGDIACGTYDDEHDDWKISEGWWEYTIYNYDEGCYPIDDFVTHWMRLPEPPKEEKHDK